jgi:Ala-tRNA(Pro) deacylase
MNPKSSTNTSGNDGGSSHTGRNLIAYLDDQGVHYRVSQHPAAYTAQELAQIEHVSGKKVIKPVVVKADGQFVICALPASYWVDLGELQKQLDARDIQLADEQTLQELFPECEIGAEPPIGRLWGIDTVMDESLLRDDMVTFQAGRHDQAVTMPLAEYRRIAQPEIAHFGRQR